MAAKKAAHGQMQCTSDQKKKEKKEKESEHA
jgi:hypothetical protein